MKLWETWKRVMFDPMKFYEEMPKDMGYRKPSVFYLKMYALTLGIIYLFLAIFGIFFAGLLGLAGGAELTVGLMVIIGVIAIIAFPVLVLFSWGMLYVGAGITHLFVLLFGGKQGFRETYKVMAYSVAPALFSMIPLVGYAASFYVLALQVIGIHKRQNLSIGRSIAVVIVPVAVIMFFFVMIYLGLVLTSVALGGGL